MRNDRQTMMYRLLRSLAVNYPILLDIGYGFEKLLILVVGQGDVSAVIRAVGGDAPQIIHESMTRERILSILTTVNSEPVFCLFSPTKKGYDLVGNLKAVLKTGTFDMRHISAVPILISERVPPDIDLSDCFSVYLNVGLQGLTIQRQEVVPPDDQVSVVLDKITDYAEDAATQEERSLKAAACFLYPIFKKENAEMYLPEYLKLVEELVFSDDENKDTNGLADIFVQELYRWQEKREFNKAYKLPYLEMEVTRDFEEVIIYDEEFLYMKDALFKEISEVLIKTFPIDILKSCLAKEGILCQSKESSYTVKVGYYNLAGEFCRVRMLRFSRNRIRLAGELDFIELCVDEGG